MRLSTVRDWLRPRLRRTVTWGVIGLATAQAVAAAPVWGVDSLRKRREPAEGGFPRTDPKAGGVAGSDLTVYTYGEDLFAAMLEAIRGAREFIFFETYIWKEDRKSTRLNSSHVAISYAVFCLKKKKKDNINHCL